MNHGKARPSKEIFIGEPEVLTKEMLATIYSPAFRPADNMKKLRHSHHRLARLVAAGLRNQEIADQTGYSMQRIWQLTNSPAFQELVAYYQKLITERLVASTDEYQTLSTSNMLLAESMIADRLAEADEEGVDLPIKDLLAISRDAADRNGYGKKSQVTHKTDFAEKLEKAIARTRESSAQPKVIQ
jgi:hypothetical protein